MMINHLKVVMAQDQTMHDRGTSLNITTNNKIKDRENKSHH